MTKQKGKQQYSRRKAREVVKEIYPDLPRHKIVHHIDLNPFNNDINNFAIMSRSDHSKLHASLIKEKITETALLYYQSNIEQKTFKWR